MDKWKNVTIQDDGATTSEEFNQFAQDWLGYFKQRLGQDFVLTNTSVNHYYISGFFRNTQTDKLGYFTVSDVRHFPGEWNTKVLVRSAEHEKDFTGGSNNFVELDNVKATAERVTQ